MRIKFLMAFTCCLLFFVTSSFGEAQKTDSSLSSEVEESGPSPVMVIPASYIPPNLSTSPLTFPW